MSIDLRDNLHLVRIGSFAFGIIFFESRVLGLLLGHDFNGAWKHAGVRFFFSGVPFPTLASHFVFKAAIAQLVARRSHNPKVASSILACRICIALHK